MSSISFISSLKSSINSKSEIGRATSFHFKITQYLPDAHEKTRTDPEEAPMEYKKSNIFDDTTTKNPVSSKKKNGHMRISKNLTT